MDRHGHYLQPGHPYLHAFIDSMSYFVFCLLLSSFHPHLLPTATSPGSSLIDLPLRLFVQVTHLRIHAPLPPYIVPVAYHSFAIHVPYFTIIVGCINTPTLYLHLVLDTPLLHTWYIV